MALRDMLSDLTVVELRWESKDFVAFPADQKGMLTIGFGCTADRFRSLLRSSGVGGPLFPPQVLVM